jgi:hypothetical protein
MQIKPTALFLDNFALSSCEKELFSRMSQSLSPLFAEEAAGRPAWRVAIN